MKKVITAGLSFAMAASMLAGCSSKPAENSDSGDKRVLKFDSFSGGNGEEVFTKLAKAFEKANPDVDVQLRFEKELPDFKNVPEDRQITIVSTSLIEACVDLDVYTVFRELKGLDNILQAGGRCNREGKRKRTRR